MKVAAALLRQWSSENPARLLQAALWQAERLSEMAPELEALRAQNASLEQQLEAQTKRLAELEKALEAAQRTAQRQAVPLPRRATKTRRGAQTARTPAWTSGRFPARA